MILAALARALQDSQTQAQRVALSICTFGMPEIINAHENAQAASDRKGIGAAFRDVAVIEEAPIVLEYVKTQLATLSPVVEEVAGTSTAAQARQAISEASTVGFLQEVVADLDARLTVAAKRLDAMNHSRRPIPELSSALERASGIAQGVRDVSRRLDEAARQLSAASAEIETVGADAGPAPSNRPAAPGRQPKPRRSRLTPAVRDRRIIVVASAELRNLDARADASIARIQSALQGSGEAQMREIVESAELEDLGSSLDDLQGRVEKAAAGLETFDPEQTEQPLQEALAKARRVHAQAVALRERIAAGYGARDSLSVDVALHLGSTNGGDRG